MEPYRPKHMGIDLDQFLNQFHRCLAEVAVCNAEEFPEIEINPELIPEIHLEPPAGD